MTELIDAKYEEALSKIKTLLFAAKSVSITTDAATMHTEDSYVTVTAHWLDAKWKMMSCVLGVAISNVSHTAEEIASLVKDLVNVEFMLENRLDSIGTDQGANFLAAIATDFMQGEEYPTLGGISRYITTLIEGLQGSVPPPHWQLQSSWNSLPDAVKRVRSYILKDMKVRWDPADPLLGMAAIVHPGHKSLSWLCASDRDKIIKQLRNEMCNVEEQQQENESIDTDVSGEEED
eukprot:Em0016g487a